MLLASLCAERQKETKCPPRDVQLCRWGGTQWVDSHPLQAGGPGVQGCAYLGWCLPGCVTVLLGAGWEQQPLHCYKAGKSSVTPRMEGYWELGRSISVGSREEVARGSGECREVMLFLTVNFRENNAENRIDFAELFITWAKSLFTQKTYHVCGTPLTVKG